VQDAGHPAVRSRQVSGSVDVLPTERRRQGLRVEWKGVPARRRHEREAVQNDRPDRSCPGPLTPCFYGRSEDRPLVVSFRTENGAADLEWSDPVSCSLNSAAFSFSPASTACSTPTPCALAKSRICWVISMLQNFGPHIEQKCASLAPSAGSI